MTNKYKTLAIFLGTAASMQAASLLITIDTVNRTFTSSGTATIATTTDTTIPGNNWSFYTGSFVAYAGTATNALTLTASPTAGVPNDGPLSVNLFNGGAVALAGLTGNSAGQQFEVSAGGSFDLSAAVYDTFLANVASSTTPVLNNMELLGGDTICYAVVPEPSSALLLGFGALALTARRKK